MKRITLAIVALFATLALTTAPAHAAETCTSGDSTAQITCLRTENDALHTRLMTLTDSWQQLATENDALHVRIDVLSASWSQLQGENIALRLARDEQAKRLAAKSATIAALRAQLRSLGVKPVA